MRILVLGINYAPEAIGIAIYTTGLCEKLVELGHEVQVVTAKPYYPQWQVHEGFRGRGWRTTVEHGVTVTRCPLYVPARPGGAKRLVHHASFAASAYRPMMKAARSFKPDVVLTIAPSLASAPLALRAARVAGAKSWLHIQDFEVDAAVATGLLPKDGAAARAARSLEQRALRGFDRVSSISAEMCRKLATSGVAPAQIVEFRNWADIAAITPLAAPSAYRLEWSIETPHVALYSGNIANKQGIEIVLDAANLLRHREDLTFVICGEGPNRATLEAQAAEQGISRILFHDLQPKSRLSELLGLATVHLLPQKAEAADLVLPSKLTNMLASGRPVIATADPDTGLAREVDGCGVLTAPGDARGFADAIQHLLDAPAERQAFGTAARRRAETSWDYDAIVRAFERELNQLVAV
ncbi:WcaI family glycosyltransferase [Sphingomonas sp.]|uniref:WcaI family glycosyltransferase n=1 Tax=Sphingomonas sp. TaxID=28214 RepID=UPI003B3A030B